MWVGDDQRRARLGVRQSLALRVADPVAATESVVCLHATEAASPYLSAWARSGATREQFAAAMYDERSLVKQLAMRRTVFVFPRDLLPAVWGSASARVVAAIAPRLAKEVEAGGFSDDGTTWLAARIEEIESALTEQPRTTAQLRELLPELNRRMLLSPGSNYAADVAIANRVVTVAAASGRVQRGLNQGGWRVMRPEWTSAEHWLGEPATPLSAADGYRLLIQRWLRQFGPGTETDLVWWLGATKAAVRRALGELDAVEVQTSCGPGYLLPDDLDQVADPEPWAALLPVLDPTTMGWKQRDFYLGEHGPHLFDRNGNGGTTAWWNGRIVGGWHQDPDAVVHVDLLEEVGEDAKRALAAKADELTEWLAGERVGSVYHSPLTRSALAD